MSILQKRQERGNGIFSKVGDVLAAPVQAVKGLVEVPFSFFKDTTTKLVIIAGIAVVGIIFLSNTKAGGQIIKRLI